MISKLQSIGPRAAHLPSVQRLLITKKSVIEMKEDPRQARRGCASQKFSQSFYLITENHGTQAEARVFIDSKMKPECYYLHHEAGASLPSNEA